MPYVRDSFWRGREFTSLQQMQAAALTWCREVANVRSHRSLDGASPVSVFDAVEATALKPLPHNDFVLATWSTGRIGPDCHLKVGKALYSVPWKLIGQQVDARAAGNTVQILHQDKVVATHVQLVRGRATDFEHYPPEKIAFHMRTPAWCRPTTASNPGARDRAHRPVVAPSRQAIRLPGGNTISPFRSSPVATRGMWPTEPRPSRLHVT